MNHVEAEAVVYVLKYLKNHSGQNDKIGVITPYSGQFQEIKRRMKEDKAALGNIEAKTVDGFQGREKDIIVFSTTRASIANGQPNKKKTIGFLRNRRRMNVSLSRARLCLVVCGDINQLQIAAAWKALIKYAIDIRSCFELREPFNKCLDEWLVNKQKFLVTDLAQFSTKNDDERGAARRQQPARAPQPESAAQQRPEQPLAEQETTIAEELNTKIEQENTRIEQESTRIEQENPITEQKESAKEQKL